MDDFTFVQTDSRKRKSVTKHPRQPQFSDVEPDDLRKPAFIRTFIRHKDRQYKIETETDRIKKISKSVSYHI